MRLLDCRSRRGVNDRGDRFACLHPRVHAAEGFVTAAVCAACDWREEPDRCGVGVPSAYVSQRVGVLPTPETEKGAPPLHWAVGMTTAPRAQPTLEESLSSLAAAGWDAPRLFVEPGTNVPSPFTKLVSGTTRHCYFSSDWQSLEERVGSASSADRQYVWGLRYIDDLLLRDRGSERFYALQDPNWNITAICGAAGTIAERYAYSAYGQPVFLSAAFVVIGASAYAWETLFSGYRWDAECGLYLARDRYLQPLLGCWVSRDPMEGAHRNMYQYCQSSPLACVDPNGAAPQKPRPQDRQPQEPPFCQLEICCALAPFPCTLRGGPNNFGKFPCHCFVRFTRRGRAPIDFHGRPTMKADPTCCGPGKKLGRLKCAEGPNLDTYVGEPGCVTVKRFPRGECADVLACLRGVTKLCAKNPACYGECGFPNSNTAAAYYLNFCAIGAAPPDPIEEIWPVNPETGTSESPCQTSPGAPGWGPLAPEPRGWPSCEGAVIV